MNALACKLLIKLIYVKKRISRLNKCSNIMKRKNEKQITYPFIFFDIAILIASFNGVHYYRQSTMSLSLIYVKLFVLILVSNILSSIVTKKYYIAYYSDFKEGLFKIISSNMLVTYIASLIILVKGLYGFSRGQLFGTITLFVGMELTLFTGYYLFRNKTKFNAFQEVNKINFPEFKKISLSLLLNDVIYLFVSFFVMTYIKRRHFELTYHYGDIFLIVSAIWIISSIFTNKFNVVRHQNLTYVIAAYIKAYVLAVLTMSVLMFVLRLFYYSRLHFFGTFTILLFIETISIYLSYLTWVHEPKSANSLPVEDFVKKIQQENLPIKKDLTTDIDKLDQESILHRLADELKNSNTWLKELIHDTLRVENIAENKTKITASGEMDNVESIINQSLHLYINLHKVNDFQRINRYFLTVHNKIDDNGYFISCAETNDVVRKKIFQGSFEFVGHIVYSIYFFVHRVIPKLPPLNKIYFFLTKGKGRAISKAEVLGRLYFCGFKVVAEKYTEDTLYFIAQRVKYPSDVQNPTYGLLVKLPRIGLNGEVKYIYKLRTMHPYSEFLQEYIYNRSKLDKSGKMADDFRLTGWGKLFRKLWIDELPQIINFMQGDLAIFGVRALSQQYFSLYPKDLQDLRTMFKPGLIPPYYADMPGSFEEIIESERRYLDNKKKAPFRTDLKYLGKALYNIIIKKARSK